jgi:hypothetical protein
MPWTSPNSPAPGEVLSAANYNAYLRDNLNYLHNGQPLGTAIPIAGGGLYSTASSAWADIDSANLSQTLTLSTGRVAIAFVGTFYADAAARLLSLDIALNGVRISPGSDGLGKEALDPNARLISFYTFKTGLSLGAHVFRLQWKVGAGLAYLFADASSRPSFSVAEW